MLVTNRNSMNEMVYLKSLGVCKTELAIPAGVGKGSGPGTPGYTYVYYNCDGHSIQQL